MSKIKVKKPKLRGKKIVSMMHTYRPNYVCRGRDRDIVKSIAGKEENGKT